jgi:hypothetical protein
LARLLSLDSIVPRIRIAVVVRELAGHQLLIETRRIGEAVTAPVTIAFILEGSVPALGAILRHGATFVVTWELRNKTLRRSPSLRRLN